MTLFAIGCVVVGPMQYGLNLILILIGCHATRKNSTAEVTALLWHLGIFWLKEEEGCAGGG